MGKTRNGETFYFFRDSTFKQFFTGEEILQIVFSFIPPSDKKFQSSLVQILVPRCSCCSISMSLLGSHSSLHYSCISLNIKLSAQRTFLCGLDYELQLQKYVTQNCRVKQLKQTSSVISSNGSKICHDAEILVFQLPVPPPVSTEQRVSRCPGVHLNYIMPLLRKCAAN